MHVPVSTIENTLRYCLNHCDNQEETDLVEWVAEKFAESLTVYHAADGDAFTARVLAKR